MGKIRVQDLARMMGISNQDLVFKLKSIGVRVEGDDAHIDTDIIQAILQGKKLPHPREVILRDEHRARAARAGAAAAPPPGRRPAVNPLRPARPRTRDPEGRAAHSRPSPRTEQTRRASSRSLTPESPSRPPAPGRERRRHPRRRPWRTTQAARAASDGPPPGLRRRGGPARRFVDSGPPARQPAPPTAASGRRDRSRPTTPTAPIRPAVDRGTAASATR